MLTNQGMRSFYTELTPTAVGLKWTHCQLVTNVQMHTLPTAEIGTRKAQAAAVVVLALWHY